MGLKLEGRLRPRPRPFSSALPSVPAFLGRGMGFLRRLGIERLLSLDPSLSGSCFRRAKFAYPPSLSPRLSRELSPPPGSPEAPPPSQLVGERVKQVAACDNSPCGFFGGGVGGRGFLERDEDSFSSAAVLSECSLSFSFFSVSRFSGVALPLLPRPVTFTGVEYTGEAERRGAGSEFDGGSLEDIISTFEYPTGASSGEEGSPWVRV